jgi:hypothetical protein
MEVARADAERQAAQQTDAVEATEHREEDRRAAESRSYAANRQSLWARLRELLQIRR